MIDPPLPEAGLGSNRPDKDLASERVSGETVSGEVGPNASLPGERLSDGDARKLASSAESSHASRAPADASFGWAGSAAVLLLLVLLNLLFSAAASYSPALAGLFVGAIGGELGLLAFGAVFAPQPLLVRWTISLALLLLLFGTIVVGAMWGSIPGFVFWRVVTTLALLLPLVSLAAQCPLVVFKLLTRLRLRRISEASRDGSPDPLSVQKLLLATVLVAVGLGLARLALIDRDWPSLAINCAMIFGGAALAIPVIWVCLSGSSVGSAVSLAMIYAGSLAAVIVVLLAVFAPNVTLEAVLAIVAMTLSVAAVLVGGLLPLRARGYRLVGKRGPPKTRGC